MSVRAGGGIQVSAGTQLAAGGVVSFSNANGVTFGLSNGTLTASAGAGGGGNTLSMYAVGNTTAQSSSSTIAESAFSLQGAGAISVGMNNGSVVVSAPNTVALTQFSAGLSNLGATSGNTGLVTAQLVFAGTNATLSGSTNAGSMTITMSVPATSSLVGAGGIVLSSAGSTISISAGQLSFMDALPQAVTTLTQVGHGSVQVYPFFNPECFSASRADILFSNSISSSTNSSHAGVISAFVGLYTRNVSTLSLASSASQSYQWSNTSNNSMGSISGLRRASVPLNVNFTGGDLWVAVMSLTSSTNANWFTASNVVLQPQMTAQLQGLIGEASNNSKQLMLGSGLWSTTSAVLPASIAFTAISGAGSAGAGANLYMSPVMFANATA